MEQTEEIEVELFISNNEYEIAQVCSILEENSIPFIRRDAGSGSYMNLYMGQSIQEKKIFVSKNDYEKALEITSLLIGNEVEEENISELNEQLEDDEEQNKYKKIGRALGILILGMPVLIILILIIISFLL